MGTVNGPQRPRQRTPRAPAASARSRRHHRAPCAARGGRTRAHRATRAAALRRTSGMCVLCADGPASWTAVRVASLARRRLNRGDNEYNAVCSWSLGGVRAATRHRLGRMPPLFSKGRIFGLKNAYFKCKLITGFIFVFRLGGSASSLQHSRYAERWPRRTITSSGHTLRAPGPATPRDPGLHPAAARPHHFEE